MSRAHPFAPGAIEHARRPRARWARRLGRLVCALVVLAALSFIAGFLHGTWS